MCRPDGTCGQATLRATYHFDSAGLDGRFGPSGVTGWTATTTTFLNGAGALQSGTISNGDPKLVFRPEANGTLLLRSENLDILREAMQMVTQDPRGTARFNLRGLQFDVAGKTGTAESGNGKSHAWFAGYTLNAADTGLPDIAIAVIVENIGEGSEYAVPIFRAMVETYYYGSPQRIFYDFGPIGEPPYTPTPFGGGNGLP